MSFLYYISEDDGVQILRLKNRFSTDWPSERSLGYRDVMLNIRIETQTTKDLGIHVHVVEVQLALDAFQSLKSDGGHQRYVEYRNTCGH